MYFDDESLERYSRQLIMPEISESGQKRLLSSKVLIIGAGGLGSPVISILAGAGIGNITIIDYDKVELSNLNRQFIYNSKNIGFSKASSSEFFIKQLNPKINITNIYNKVENINFKEHIKSNDIVIDCSDNFKTRYLVNDICQNFKKNLIFGSAVKFDGQFTSFVPENNLSPCLRCIFPEGKTNHDQRRSCSQSGIIGAITMIVGSLQALEAIKMIVQSGKLSFGRLLLFDGYQLSFNEIKVNKNSNCSCNFLN